MLSRLLMARKLLQCRNGALSLSRACGVERRAYKMQLPAQWVGQVSSRNAVPMSRDEYSALPTWASLSDFVG